jgi:DNA repair protein RadA
MVDSPHHPEEEVIFALGEAGVMDPEEAEKKTKKSVAKKDTKKTTKKDVSKEKIEIPEMATTEGNELTTVETPEITEIEDQKVPTVETPEVLELSEALDEEFSDSVPTDE